MFDEEESVRRPIRDAIRDGQQVEVIGERRTDYKLHLGADGNPAVARLTVQTAGDLGGPRLMT